MPSYTLSSNWKPWLKVPMLSRLSYFQCPSVAGQWKRKRSVKREYIIPSHPCNESLANRVYRAFTERCHTASLFLISAFRSFVYPWLLNRFFTEILYYRNYAFAVRQAAIERAETCVLNLLPLCYAGRAVWTYHSQLFDRSYDGL